MNDHGALLHNMSAPPRSVVKYAGLNNLSDPAPEGASPAASRAPEVFGTPIRFVLPGGLSRKGPAGLLRHLGVKPGAHPEEALCTLIDQRAEELPLPDGCVVVLVAPVHRVVWSDTLAVLAVLTKCSAAVWLRAKTPSVRAALARREVSLLVPPSFAIHLPEPGS
jgi:hypothetical protein